MYHLKIRTGSFVAPRRALSGLQETQGQASKAGDDHGHVSHVLLLTDSLMRRQDIMTSKTIQRIFKAQHGRQVHVG